MSLILSIVTGTYNRLPSLQRMIASARAGIPVGIAYEFVIVDGGSTDGTQDWCKQQPDIKLVEHNELLGAIAAFCDGAKAARADYVLLANDDVTFEPGSIVSALVALETQPYETGALAFYDNRPAPGYEGQGYKVQTMPVIVDGQEVRWPYAQVGLFRKWLGDLCGWWGADDPQFPGTTYGGDNYLTARIIEHGYKVIDWELSRVTDHVEPDALRERNYQIEQRNPGAYYKRYPKPPVFGTLPQPENPQTERLRTLYLPLYEPGYGQYKRGLREALQRVGLVWEVDYLNTQPDLVAAVRQFQPHLLLMQCHSPQDVPAPVLAEMRAVQPQMLVVNWNGDVYEDKLTSAAMLAWLRHVDIQLTVNADVLDTYAQHNIPAAYWQVAFEPVDYDHLPAVAAHDVVLLANAYSPSRKQLGHTLRNLSGVNVGLYGREWQWGNGDTTYNFAASAALCQQAKICVGDNQYGKRGFVSNRIFETLAAGGFLLHQHVPGLEELTGLRAGVHYVEWTDTNDLTQKIAHWLMASQGKQRAEIAAAGRDYVRTRHSFDARVRELLREIVPRLERQPA